MDAIYRLWREHEDRIERVVRRVCRRYRFLDEDAEDFHSVVVVHFFDPTKSPLLRIRNAARWDTYLTVVITNLGRDYADRLYGKWRPCGKATEFGEVGVMLEMRLHRDRLTLETATRYVMEAMDGSVTRKQLLQIYAQLPADRRGRPDRVDVDQVDREPSGSGDRPQEGRERLAEWTRANTRARELIAQLGDMDRKIMELRFEGHLTLTLIAKDVGLPFQRVQERIVRSCKGIRSKLEEEGFDPDDIFDR